MKYLQNYFYSFLIHFVLLYLPISSSSQPIYFPPNAPSNQWDSISISSLGWCQNELDSLLNFLESKNTKAFIVLKNGKIVVEKYFGTFTIDSTWYWASAGKTLTSFAIGLAQQDGLLSISHPTSQYLGTGWTIAPPNKESLITIQNQLSMTSGLNDAVPDHYCTIDTCLAYLADAGSRWAYHNGPYTLLDSVLENATGQSLNSYFNQKIKTPTGMTGQFYPSGFNHIFVSKPRSMARFGLLMLNKGIWNSTPIMTDTNFFYDMTHPSQNLNKSYGYFWWLNGQSSYMLPSTQFIFNGPLSPNAPNDMIAALGKNGQFLNISSSQKLVWVRMGNEPSANEVPAILNDSIWYRLNQVMCTSTNSTMIEENNKLAFYPNPFTTSFSIATDISNYQLTLSNLQGQIIFSTIVDEKHKTFANINLKSGTYVACLIKDHCIYAKKMVTILP